MAKERRCQCASLPRPDNAEQWKDWRELFRFEDNTIQPFVKLVTMTLWWGNHIGHHSVMHDQPHLLLHML